MWRNLQSLINEDRLVAAKEVRKELARVDDEIHRWVKGQTRMFKSLDKSQFQAARDIVNCYEGLFDIEKATPEADPFVIALAIVEERKKNLLVSPKGVVVSEEAYVRGSTAKIPNVCRNYGIECISLLEMFKKENWSF